MDFDDLLAELFGDAVIDQGGRRRMALVVRMVFGLAGAALSVAGALLFLTRPALGGTPAMRACMAAVFAGLAAFCAFNVMLGRSWRWPWLLAGGSLVALFVMRLAGL